MRESRLNRFQENKTKRVLILRLLGSAVIVVLLVWFGVPALINLSLFLGSFHKDSGTTTQAQNQQQYIAPPIFTPTFSATNSASVNLTGTATVKTTVKLYLNSNYLTSVPVDDNGNFSFPSVTLSQGNNTFQAKATISNNESDFSDSLSIQYLNKPPKLDVNNPHDGDQFDKNTPSVSITGDTDPNVTVTINGYQAIVDQSGNFSYTFQLKSGDNPLKVIATDAAGNTTEKDLTVKSNQ